jgi:hypothetical protein
MTVDAPLPGFRGDRPPWSMNQWRTQSGEERIPGHRRPVFDK